MSDIVLKQPDYQKVLDSLTDNSWLVVCFCAHWCNACRDYKPGFKEFAARHPDVRFLWIDIEDHADLLGDLDVEHFPSLLIQYGDIVNFFSSVHPDPMQAERILQSQMELSVSELERQAMSSSDRRDWQENANLKKMLREGLVLRS